MVQMVNLYTTCNRKLLRIIAILLFRLVFNTTHSFFGYNYMTIYIDND
jgi:hypothetical protein